MTTETIAIFLARGGSKRIPYKNIIDFHGKPIIQYPYESAVKSNIFKTIHISTDDPIVLETIKKIGHVPEFIRSSELAQDQIPALTVVRWILNKFINIGKTFQSACLIFPCSPLITANDFRTAFDIFKNNEMKYPVMSMSTYPVPIEWAMKQSNNGVVVPYFPELMSFQSQNFNSAIYDTGNFVFFNIQNVLESEYLSFPAFLPYILPRERSVDIDSMEDLHLAKTLFLLRKNEL